MACLASAFLHPPLAAERNLFTRERNDGLYYVITNLLFKLVEELFLAVCMTLAVGFFYGIGLQGQFFLYWLNSLVTLSNGISEWLAAVHSLPHGDSL